MPTQAFQSGKYSIVRDTATTNAMPTTVEDFERYDVRTGTAEGQGTLLLVIVNRFFFWFNASPTLAANISQESTSGSWVISLPNTPTTNKSIFMPDKGVAIVYNSANYGFDANNINPFPLQIRALVSGQPTGTLKCTILSDGNIVWPDVSARTAAAIGATGLVQYTIS